MVAVAGNHDHAAIGLIDASDFNESAKIAANWTANQLDHEQKEFLASLPLVAVQDTFTLVHGSLRAPIEEYLLDRNSAMGTLAILETQYCLVGHSHIPFRCLEIDGDVDFYDFTEDELIEMTNNRQIVNPGGVGQPRDRNPRSSYAIYDSTENNLVRHRVDYDILKTQRKMVAADLPSRLIERLGHGL